MTGGRASELKPDRRISSTPCCNHNAGSASPYCPTAGDGHLRSAKSGHFNSAVTEKRAAAQKSHDLVFIGDSITHFWEDRNGPEVWRDYYGRREVFNLGFGWDRTQNAFWRLLNGEFAEQRPKLLVLNIGTNNLTAGRVRANTPEEVAAGVAGVCRLVHELSPETKILDMHIFPRGAKDTELFQSVMRTNALLDQELKSLPYVSVMDITAQLVDAKGDAHPELFTPDLTHPGPRGYAVWAAAIEPVVKAALGD